MFLCDNMGDDKDALFVNFMRYYPTIQSASEYLQKFDNLQNAYLNIRPASSKLIHIPKRLFQAHPR